MNLGRVTDADLLIERERRRRTQALAQVSHPLPDPVAWMTENFFIPELHGPITIAPYQQQALEQALARDENGMFRHSLILWSDLKKSAKTSIAAAVMCWLAWNRPGARIRLVGNDLKQADSRVFAAIVEVQRLNPEWRGIQIVGYKARFPNGSIIESVPVDPSGEAGGNDDAISFTELWAYKSKAQRQIWTELTLSPTKFGQSFRWIDTYAGHSGESPILEPLYEQLVKPENQVSTDPPIYTIPGARMFCLWNTTPRLSWQTPEYYAEQSATLLPGEFLRIHANQWTTSTDSFIQPEWWNACRQPMPPLTPGTPMVVSMDAAVSGDCFGIVAVTKQGRPPEQGGDIVDVRSVRKWTPGRDGKLLYANPEKPDDIDFPEGYVSWLCRNYNVVQVAYDEYQLHDFANRMRVKLERWFRAFPQGQDRLVSDANLRTLIVDRRIRHDGNLDLAEHARNAAAKSENGKLRIVKKAENLKVDLIVCVSMGAHEMLRLQV